MTAITPTPPIVDVRSLTIGLSGESEPVAIVRDVDLLLPGGGALGIVGESGCGKSTLLLAIMGFMRSGLTKLDGQCLHREHDLFTLDDRTLRDIRGGTIALVPQSASRALTPTRRVRDHLTEAIRLHANLPPDVWPQRAVELLESVRLPEPALMLDRFPHQLSGGQLQRVAIAMALAGNPDVLLLDEPTSGLDVTTSVHILELLKRLRVEHALATICVSHDIAVVRRIAETVIVMYAGEIVEQGPTQLVLGSPGHPYTRGLLSSVPSVRRRVRPVPMAGQLPRLSAVRQGCAFADRCPVAALECTEQAQPSVEIGDAHRVRCWHHEPSPSAAPSDDGYETALVHDVPLLALRNVAISYGRPALFTKRWGTDVVTGLDLDVFKGEILGLVGESGSGKSTILRAIVGLHEHRAGRITLDGSSELRGRAEHRDKATLRRIQLIFQNPDESLNPRRTVRDAIERPLKRYTDLGPSARRDRVVELIESVRLGSHHLERYPAQLSGGERQRVAIARAFAADPDLLLCDEVTSALDVSVQAVVLDVLQRMSRENGTTVVFVSHDLGAVRAIADRVGILFSGQLCEIGTAKDVFGSPFHPYTSALLDAASGEPSREPEDALTSAPSQATRPPGCPYVTRCPIREQDLCVSVEPPWRPYGSSGLIRCHLAPERLHVGLGVEIPR